MNRMRARSRRRPSGSGVKKRWRRKRRRAREMMNKELKSAESSRRMRKEWGRRG